MKMSTPGGELAKVTMPKDSEVLEYLINEVLAEPDKLKPVWSSLRFEGINDWRDLLDLLDSDIDRLRYSVPRKNEKEFLGRGHRNKLRLLRKYIFYLHESDDSILDLGVGTINLELMKITKEVFDMYRIDHGDLDGTTVDSNSTQKPDQQTSTTAQLQPKDPTTSFKQSIKKDKTQYNLYKDEKFWDQWNQSFTITARSHDLAEILDPNYKPKTESDIRLFKAKQSFAYSVLHHTLLTDMGKTLVRQHLDTLDAQTVYKELCAYHANSTNAKVNASALLTYITTVRFDTTWRGTAQAFLLHWKNQLRQLDDIQPDSDRFSKPLRKVMLENAVHAVEELRSVKALEDHNVTLGKDPLSYEEYFQWLHSAAARFDSETANKKCFKVQQTLSAPHHSPYDLQDDDDYGIGYPTQPTCTVCKIDMSPGEFLAANMTQGMPSSGSHGRGEMRCPNPKDSNRLTIPTTRVMGKDV